MLENSYLSVKQTCKRYDVARTTIYRWVQKGIFPKPVKLSPGCTRWQLSRLEEWEQAKQDNKNGV